ncbi:MAG: low affinity iron permease family protein [Ilumatobacteraceae bacterium]|nr:low affinity iron permease family protein [Ilumatobacteraceae bacterium]
MNTADPSSESHRPTPASLLKPSEVSSRVGFFDRFAGLTAQMASRAPFFAFCLLLVIIWLIQGAVKIISNGKFSSFLDGQYQLEINTTTTIITFLMVALLQNSQTRSDQALQHKLNAIADGMADLMDHLSERHDDDDLRDDIRELRLAVGLENIESTDRQRAQRSDPDDQPKPGTPQPSG